EDYSNNPDIKEYLTVSSQLYLIFNKKEGVFTDPKMRQAINTAINNEEILYGSFGNEELYQFDHGFMAKHIKNWYTDEGEEFYFQNDLEKAKKLVEESDYDGEEITMIAFTDSPYNEGASLIIQEQMRNFGLDVKVETMDYATLAEKREDPSAWDMYVNYTPDVSTPSQILTLGPTWAGWADDAKLRDMQLEVVAAESHEEAMEK